MGSTADKEKDFPAPIKGHISHKEWEQKPCAPPKADLSLDYCKHLHPEPPCSITEQVVNDFKTRSLLGLSKYGTTLDRQDLDKRAWLQHLYEEILDAAKYLKRLMQEIDELDRAK